MTRQDLIESLINYAGDDYDQSSEQLAFITSTVDDAINEVCNEMYPYDYGMEEEDDSEESEEEESASESIRKIALRKYGNVIRRIAQFHYDKQGKEGVTTFYESGQTTSFSGGGTPREYLDGIVPVAKIV